MIRYQLMSLRTNVKQSIRLPRKQKLSRNDNIGRIYTPSTSLKMTLFVILLILLSFPAIAQDKYDSKDYSPDYCQFTATFPDEPYITNHCEGESEDTCYNLISYTKVFDVRSTVRVEIICNPSTPAMYKEFTPKIMEKTVKAMTKDTVIETYEINSRQEEEYRQTGLLGKARRGLGDTIYIAQLWVAENSIMSVEAELMGEPSADADKLFAQILNTIGFAKDIKKDEKPAKGEGEGEGESKTHKQYQKD